jgi:DNA (cytosine-5)-methyltransferase 3A
LREEIKPKYYLLENVEMGEKWEKVLSKAVGVNGIHINSALVSAQSRKRIYWINFGMKPMGLFGDMQSIVEQPKDRGILLKDILEEEVDEKYFLSEKMLNYFDKRAANYNNGKVNIRNNDDKASTITASYSSCDISDNFIKVEFPAIFDDYNGRFRKDGKSCTLTLNSGSKSERNGQKVVLGDLKESLLSGLKSKDKRLKKMIENSDLVDGEVVHLDTYNQTLDREKSPALKLPHNDRFLYAPTLSKEEYKFRQDTPIPEDKDKFGSLRANAGGKTRGVGLELLSSRIRRLTPLEAKRLQTVADDYKMPVSDSQAYRQLGNGWNIETIVHLFNYITLEK